MMKRRLTRLLAALTVLAMTAAACGSDGETTETATPTEESSDAAAEAPAQDSADADGDGDGDHDDDDGDHEDGDDDDDDGDHEDGDHDDDDDDDHEDGDHDDVLEVPDAMAVPQVDVEVLLDPKSGQNVHVTLADFRLAPEHASTDPVDGEGHLHLYVDGEKITRLYTEWYAISLEPGDHEVMVEVSANNHAPYGVDGQPIQAATTISVPAAEASHTDHEPIEVSTELATPSVTLEVLDDPKSGWNLHAQVENFTITPENVSTEPVDGEGHLHIYVDGEKITRLYGEWYHLAALTEGTHAIAVELSANNHAPYTLDGVPITASVDVDVSPDRASEDGLGGTGEADDHDHEDGEGSGGLDSPAADADVVVEATYQGGSVTIDDDRVAVERGSTVAIVVDSDTAEELHVHGYDVFADVVPGETATIVFVAGVPGLFEVELEKSHEFLFELQVS